MKNTGKKLAASLLSLAFLFSFAATLPMDAVAEGKNLITNSTPIALLRPDKDITDVSKVWSWKNGVLTSLDKNREDSNVVFQLEGLDNTKTYRYAGKLKILEFGSDTGWYGPRLITRGKNRPDIENCDYSALSHFQNTEVFINNFINSATLPYEVANVRAKINTEIPFEIYVSPEKTLVYYAGKQRFYVDNSPRVTKLPYAFGFWTIGCSVQFSELSLTETTMPTVQTTTKPPQIGTTAADKTATTTAGKTGIDKTTSPSQTGQVTDVTTTPPSDNVTVSTEISGATGVEGTLSTSNRTLESEPAGNIGKPPEKSSGIPWLIPVIVVVVVLISAGAALFYVMVIRKGKNSDAE